MGVRNYLIEGVSGVGKTTVCDALIERGYHAIHGDRELAYQGDPETGEPLGGASHFHHIWDIAKVRSLLADHTHPMTFFCGGSRNFHHFIDSFDRVFVLDVDRHTLMERLVRRPDDEFGGKQAERDFIANLHDSKEDIPRNGIAIDATAPLSDVVDAILSKI